MSINSTCCVLGGCDAEWVFDLMRSALLKVYRASGSGDRYDHRLRLEGRLEDRRSRLIEKAGRLNHSKMEEASDRSDDF